MEHRFYCAYCANYVKNETVTCDTDEPKMHSKFHYFARWIANKTPARDFLT